MRKIVVVIRTVNETILSKSLDIYVNFLYYKRFNLFEVTDMYDPVEAKMSYAALLKSRGQKAAFQSALLTAVSYLHSVYLMHQNPTVETLVLTYLLSACFFTWKPKLTRFLRGKLRGEEWRDKKDEI